MERHAAEAALAYVRDDMTIGLGSGKAIEYLVEFLSMRRFSNLKIVTTRMETAILAQKRGLNVIPCWMVSSLDYAFDTLDYVTKELDGAKTQTTIIADDKILASMAKQFIALVSRDNFVEVLAPALPVEVEVAKPAFSYVSAQLQKLGGSVVELSGAQKEPLVSQNGNYILYASFKAMDDVKTLNEQISTISGVVATSLFTGLNATALVYDKDTVETVTLEG